MKVEVEVMPDDGGAMWIDGTLHIRITRAEYQKGKWWCIVHELEKKDGYQAAMCESRNDAIGWLIYRLSAMHLPGPTGAVQLVEVPAGERAYL